MTCFEQNYKKRKNIIKFLIFQQQQQRNNTNNQTSYVKEEQQRQMLTAAHVTMQNGRGQNSNTLPSCNGCRELKRWAHVFLIFSRVIKLVFVTLLSYFLFGTVKGTKIHET